MATSDAETVDGVGPRLKGLRLERGTTITRLAADTGISASTLSRLESGVRRPTLELLLPLARAYGVGLDDLVGAPPTADPRVRTAPVRRGPLTLQPLTDRPGGLRAYKITLDPVPSDGELRSHEGYEWLFVLSGRLRLRLGELDLTLKPGEAAEFDTRTPHALGPATARPVELLVLFGPQGEKAHLRARPRQTR